MLSNDIGLRGRAKSWNNQTVDINNKNYEPVLIGIGVGSSILWSLSAKKEAIEVDSFEVHFFD